MFVYIQRVNIICRYVVGTAGARRWDGGGISRKVISREPGCCFPGTGELFPEKYGTQAAGLMA